MGGDFCFKCGKNRVVVIRYDVVGVVCRGGKVFLIKEGEIFLVKLRMVNLIYI